VGTVSSSSIGPQTIAGSHYSETRNVIPFSFDDSIDPTHPLDCFFQMPAGVLKLYSAKVFVRADKFRAYASATSSGGGSTTSTGSPHTHLVPVSYDNTSSDGHAHDAHAHDANHTGISPAPDPHSSHQHSAGPHSHTYLSPATAVQSETPGHTHSVNTAHSHGITYGIFESAASFGTLSVKVADDGVTFGSAVASGATPVDVDIATELSTTKGDRQLRIETAGTSVQCRVKVLLMLDVLLKVDVDS